MKYYIREKLISLHHRFYVYKEDGHQAYEISSRMISIGDKTTLYDMKGGKHAYIEQRILHLMSHYDIYLEDHLACSINKKFRLLKNDYGLSNGYRVDGNILALNFTIIDSHGKMILMARRWAVLKESLFLLVIAMRSQSLIISRNCLPWQS